MQSSSGTPWSTLPSSPPCSRSPLPGDRRFLHARIGRVLAEDIASETFTVAFRRRASYDLSRPNARPWLYGIAVNLMRDHRRTEERRLSAYARAAAHAEEVQLDEPEAGLDRTVAAALLELSAERSPSHLAVRVGSALLRGTCRGIESPAWHGSIATQPYALEASHDTRRAGSQHRFPRVTGRERGRNPPARVRRDPGARRERGRGARPGPPGDRHRQDTEAPTTAALAPDYRSCRRSSRRFGRRALHRPPRPPRREDRHRDRRGCLPCLDAAGSHPSRIFRTNGLLTERWATTSAPYAYRETTGGSDSTLGPCRLMFYDPRINLLSVTSTRIRTNTALSYFAFRDPVQQYLAAYRGRHVSYRGKTTFRGVPAYELDVSRRGEVVTSYLVRRTTTTRFASCHAEGAASSRQRTRVSTTCRATLRPSACSRCGRTWGRSSCTLAALIHRRARGSAPMTRSPEKGFGEAASRTSCLRGGDGPRRDARFGDAWAPAGNGFPRRRRQCRTELLVDRNGTCSQQSSDEVEAAHRLPPSRDVCKRSLPHGRRSPGRGASGDGQFRSLLDCRSRPGRPMRRHSAHGLPGPSGKGAHHALEVPSTGDWGLSEPAGDPIGEHRESRPALARFRPQERPRLRARRGNGGCADPETHDRAQRHHGQSLLPNHGLPLRRRSAISDGVAGELLLIV